MPRPAAPHRLAGAGLAAAALLLGACASAPPPAPGLGIAADAPGHRGGIVAVANPHAAAAGAQVLQAGGNAIDAAVAIAYALNVVEPQSAGIGGGGFMLVRLADGRAFAVDSRETAPAAATRDQFVGVPEPSLQGLAVGVPGMVRGTALALARWGTRPLADVLAPAITLADTGFAATPRYAALACHPRALNSAPAAALLCPEGRPPAVGSRVGNPALAATLRAIATHGPDCFYREQPDRPGCDIARGILEGQRFERPAAAAPGAPPGSASQEAVRRAPPGEVPAGDAARGVGTGAAVSAGGSGARPSAAGRMTAADLAAYRPVVRPLIEGRYRGWRVLTMGPPSSGGLALLQALAVLERLPLGDAAAGFGPGTPTHAAAVADALRIAFADRAAWVGDPDATDVPVQGLLAPGYLAKRAALLRPGARLAPDPAPGDPRPHEPRAGDPSAASVARPDGPPAARRFATGPLVDGPGETTTHFSVADAQGNVVSYTNTIESLHGIGVLAGRHDAAGRFRSHGFLLNNELTDFNLAPSVHPFTGGAGANDVAPGRRPRSSMTPTLLLAPDGTPRVALGSPGGATIIGSVLQVIVNLVDHRMTLQQAVDAPRLAATGTGPALLLETAAPAALAAGLQAQGYTVQRVPDIGAVQALSFDPARGAWHGAADPRREGTVIGLPR